jgi:DedD protein
MRLPFFRVSKAESEPNRPNRGKAKPAAGSVKDALGMPGDEPLQAARTRARRRLIGAAVLLAVGVIGFPVLFETKPRPLPVDLPMLLPEGVGRKVAAASAPAALPRPPADAGVESGPTLLRAAAPTLPAVPASAPAASASGVAAAGLVAAPKLAVAASAAAAPAPAKAPAPVPVASAAVKTSNPAPRVAEALVQPAAPSSSVAAAKPAPPAAEAAPAGTGRFVVQVGAYNDAERLRSARQKLEKMGLKSYTQDVETSTGKRTRVRVGPYPTRKEADAVAAKVKASGMQANILAL